jgi:hypothetical protein
MGNTKKQDPCALFWLANAVEKQTTGTFEGSAEESLLWLNIARVEKETGCDPVRAVRLINEGSEDLLVFSFSYFSISVLGIFNALQDPTTEYVVLMGQEEPLESENLIPVGEVLLDSLYVLVKRICNYSIGFDHRFRDKFSLEGGADVGN